MIHSENIEVGHELSKEEFTEIRMITISKRMP
jgi:hypothetical protein